MKIIIETPFVINDNAGSIINKKLESLEAYKMGITQIDLYFKIDDGVDNKVAVAEIEIHKPGPTIFASSKNEDFEKAFNDAFAKAKRQILKSKEQLKSH